MIKIYDVQFPDVPNGQKQVGRANMTANGLLVELYEPITLEQIFKRFGKCGVSICEGTMDKKIKSFYIKSWDLADGTGPSGLECY